MRLLHFIKLSKTPQGIESQDYVVLLDEDMDTEDFQEEGFTLVADLPLENGGSLPTTLPTGVKLRKEVTKKEDE